MAKLDYKKLLKPLYKPGDSPVVIEVPKLNYLMIDGKGDPNTAQSYSDAVSALYKLAYGIRFFMRDEKGVDFGVMPLEGLWWVETIDQFSYEDKNNWWWTMMIMQPESVTAEDVEIVRPRVITKHKIPQVEAIRLETYEEGTCAQVMHHGPYADEKPSVDRLHAFIEQQGCQPHLKHHEIYLNDPNRVAPENY